MWNKLKNLLKQAFDLNAAEEQATVLVNTPEPTPAETPFETPAEIKEKASKKKGINKKKKVEYSSTPVVKRLKKQK